MTIEGNRGEVHLRDWLRARIEEKGLEETAGELLIPVDTLKCVLDLEQVNGALLRHLRDFQAKVDGDARQSVGEAGLALMDEYAGGRVKFSGEDYSGGDLHGAWLPGTDFSYSNLGGCNLRDAWLLDSDLGVVNLDRAELTGANLSICELVGTNFAGAILRGTGLAASMLRHANFEGADLRGACLAAANLRGAKLKGAHLEGADLRYADMTDAFIDGARFDGAWLDGAILPPGARVAETGPESGASRTEQKEQERESAQ
ncbi:MAG: pentapeptide repeat-containing protein [Dehalococcoidia bacterium]|nr:pentapeptide repeat-containing protein [Dehalococcoidia bacterium]